MAIDTVQRPLLHLKTFGSVRASLQIGSIEPTIWSVMLIDGWGTHILISSGGVMLGPWRWPWWRWMTVGLRGRRSAWRRGNCTWWRTILAQVVRSRGWREPVGIRIVILRWLPCNPDWRRRRVGSMVVLLLIRVMLPVAFISYSIVNQSAIKDD